MRNNALQLTTGDGKYGGPQRNAQISEVAEPALMPVPNTVESLRRELANSGLHPGMTVMVHSSLRKVGWTVGGPVTVIRALLDVLGAAGTLVMPAESPQVSDPSTWNDDRVKVEWHGSSLHYAESLVPARRTTISRHPIVQNGERAWVERPDMAFDNGAHFPTVGAKFAAKGPICAARVGDADAMLFSTRDLVDFAESYFLIALD